MRKGVIRSVFLIVLLMSAVLAQAAVYHVAFSGADTNPGTEQRPFRTLQHAADLMAAGDTCIVHRGTYRETVRPANSGLEGKPITFLAAPGERVVISGADEVKGWTVYPHEKYQNRIFQAKVDWETDQLFVGEQMMTDARYPNTGADPLHPTLTRTFIPTPENPKDAKRPEKDADIVKVEALANPDAPADLWTGAKIWIVGGNRWVAQVGTVESSNGDTLKIANRSGWWRMGAGMGYLTGQLNLLDTAREWCQQGDMVYFWPPFGGNPDDIDVSAKRRQYAFDLRERGHITVKGFRIFAASVFMDQANHCTLDGCQVQYPTHFFPKQAGFNRDKALNVNSEGLGITVGGEYNAVLNCTIAYSAGDGVSVYGSNNRVENCLIHDCDYSGTDCAPICVTGVGHVIAHNTAYNGGRSILVHRYLKQGKILYNHLYNAGLLTRDLGMTYSFVTDGEGTEIAYNLIHDNFAEGWGCVGIYLDNGCSNHVVHHNVIWHVSEAIALNPTNKYDKIYNNTCVGMRASIGCASPKEGSMTGTEFKNNIFTGVTGIDPTAVQENNVTYKTSPDFVNPLSFDFRLMAGSPAIDAGQVLKSYAEKFGGKAPDAGAYEYGQPAWVAGATITEE